MLTGLTRLTRIKPVSAGLDYTKPVNEIWLTTTACFNTSKACGIYLYNKGIKESHKIIIWRFYSIPSSFSFSLTRYPHHLPLPKFFILFDFDSVWLYSADFDVESSGFLFRFMFIHLEIHVLIMCVWKSFRRTIVCGLFYYGPFGLNVLFVNISSEACLLESWHLVLLKMLPK